MTPMVLAFVRGLASLEGEAFEPISAHAREILRAEGRPLPEPRSSVARSTAAERQARYRSRHAVTSRDVTRDVTRDVGGVGGDPFSARENAEKGEREEDKTGISPVTRASESDVTRDVTPVTPPRPCDPMGDAELAAVWADAADVTQPRGAALTVLLDCVAKRCPAKGAAERSARAEWAKTKAVAWRATAPTRANAFVFVDWVDAGERPSGTRAARHEPAQRSEGASRRWKVGGTT